MSDAVDFYLYSVFFLFVANRLLIELTEIVRGARSLKCFVTQYRKLGFDGLVEL